ncbi:MAG: SDR family oxidoreductase [Chloroflexi bacterium]|nr:SDR family oxidoreductase [Chloroflexota bacterium]
MDDTGAQRVAVVTGGGSGIGRAVARGLCRAGYHVVIVGRRPDRLRETASDQGPPGSITPLVADVTDAAQVAEAFRSIEERSGRLDLLFNNAGAWAPAVPIDEIDPDDWRRVVEVNLTGAFLCTQHAVRLMRGQRPPGGRIINNGSVSAQVPRPHAAAYTAAKHAITGLTKATALDGRPFAIACGQIDLGNARTDQTVAQSTGVLQADGSMRPEATMDVESVVRAVLMMAALPLEANVQSLTVIATGMPFIGRG